MKKRIATEEIYIVHAETLRNWGYTVDVDADQWREYVALKRKFLKLNRKFVQIHEKANDAWLAAQRQSLYRSLSR